MFEIVGTIITGLVKGVIEGVNANAQKLEEISNRIISLLRAGADAVEAARASALSEDAATQAALAEARLRLTMAAHAGGPVHAPIVPVALLVPTPMPPDSGEFDVSDTVTPVTPTDPGKKVPE